MPSGTGKTVSLLSLIVAYLQVNKHVLTKLVYCSRTVQEINKVGPLSCSILPVPTPFSPSPLHSSVPTPFSLYSPTQVMEELKQLMEAYRKEIGHAPEILGLALSARKNLCIHPEVKTICCNFVVNVLLACVWSHDHQVSKEDEGKLVDNKCHKLTASFQRRKHERDNRVPVCSFFEVCR